MAAEKKKKVQETLISFEFHYITPLQIFFHLSNCSFSISFEGFFISTLPLTIKILALNSSYPTLLP